MRFPSTLGSRVQAGKDYQRLLPGRQGIKRLSGVEAAATGAVDSDVVDGVCAGLTVTSSRDTVTTSWEGDGGTVPSRSRLLGDDLEGRARGDRPVGLFRDGRRGPATRRRSGRPVHQPHDCLSSTAPADCRPNDQLRRNATALPPM
jgi:hypothetical protein